MQQEDDPYSPTRLESGTLNSALLRNIEVLTERRHAEAAQAGLQERIADKITGFTGSMAFVYLHLVAFGFWITANLGWIPGVPQWDPSFVVLAMEASVEAIFLSTFVLISQNRMMSAADRRADLDLQINLLTEHEVTKLAGMVRAIAEKLDVAQAQDHEVREIERDVAPEAVLDVMDGKEEAPPG
ncbi:DUF1003 domain-containing protein [Sphingomonas xinjiangensis]|uniref:Putative membrane protein n=1 Tax=Sphingomonas xinjiangensis TaxID=643568 RepID=A0A840YE59_9SPHN|nr:DUF1003 domain-containing protein [Sphingomonas xinjiangensis]MBB5710575.1 putative membrane protein [Sphingomonas xinjiangensis]